MSSCLDRENFQLSAEENVADKVEKRKDKCRRKSLAAIAWHPSRPTISEREAITISSTFTARALPLSFYLCLLSFQLFFLQLSFLFCFHHLWRALLSSLRLTVVVDMSPHQPLYELMNADLSEEYKPTGNACMCVRVCACAGVCVRVFPSGMCDVYGATWGRPAAVPAAVLLWDNGWGLPRLSHYRSHINAPVLHTNTHPLVCCHFAASLRGFTPRLIGLNQSWQYQHLVLRVQDIMKQLLL